MTGLPSTAKILKPWSSVAAVIGMFVVLLVLFRVMNKTSSLSAATATTAEQQYAEFLEIKDRMMFVEEKFTVSGVEFSKSINGTCSEITILPVSVTTASAAMTACAEAGNNINNFQQPCLGVVPKTFNATTLWFACLKTVANRNEGTWLRAPLAQGYRPKYLNSSDYATYVKSLSKENMMELCAQTPDCVGIRVDPTLGYLKCQETQYTFNKNDDYWILQSEADKGGVGRLIDWV